MPLLKLPCTIYQTQHRFNDNSTDDMRYGDLTETQLRGSFDLDDVSDIVNPWTGQEVSIFNTFRKSRPKSKSEIVDLLFNEFLRLSMPAYYLGRHQLFKNIVNHFYRGRGNDYSSPFLDSAYKELIISGQSSAFSSLNIIKSSLDRLIITEQRSFSDIEKNLMTQAIRKSILPKFNRWADCINGLGISIHDIYATKIQITELKITNNSYITKVKFTAQDHFGLDRTDIMNRKFHYIRAFRIWFILQRWEKFGFQPFFTNMKAEFQINSQRNR